MTWTAEELTRLTKLSKQQIVSIGAALDGGPNAFHESDLLLIFVCDILAQLGFNDNDLNAIATEHFEELGACYGAFQRVPNLLVALSVADNKYTSLYSPFLREHEFAFYNIKERERVKTIPEPLISLTISVRLLYVRLCEVLRSRPDHRAEVPFPPTLPSAEEASPPHTHPPR